MTRMLAIVAAVLFVACNTGNGALSATTVNAGSGAVTMVNFAKWYGAALQAEIDTSSDGGSTWTPTLTTVWALIEVTGVDANNNVVAQISPCHAALPTVDGYSPSIKDAAVSALTPVTIEATPTMLTDPNTGNTSVQLDMSSWSAMVWGANLVNPFPVGATPADALPTSSSDPRVVDVDHDGNPGITVNATSFVNLYSVLRTTFRIHGLSDPNNDYWGQPEQNTDYTFLGDNVGGLAVSQVNSKLASTQTRNGPTAMHLAPLTALGDMNAPAQSCSAVLNVQPTP